MVDTTGTFLRGQDQEVDELQKTVMDPANLVPSPSLPVGYRVLSVQPNSPCTEGRLLALGYHGLRPWLREHISSELPLAQKQLLKSFPPGASYTQQGNDTTRAKEDPNQGQQDQPQQEEGNGETSSSRDEIQEPQHSNVPGNHQLVSFLDVVVRINGKDLTQFDELLAKELKNNCGYPVRLDVYNTKTQCTRAVEMVPHEWCGVGTLGMYVRFSDFEEDTESVLHLTHVVDGSPADMAGLVPGDDYILGAREASFSSVDEFSDYIFQKAGEPVTLYIYSRSRDAVREQSLFITTREWMPGQTGLGCQVAQGKLHHLPNRDTLGINEWLDRFITSNNISKLHKGVELQLPREGLEARAINNGRRPETSLTGEEQTSQNTWTTKVKEEGKTSGDTEQYSHEQQEKRKKPVKSVTFSERSTEKQTVPQEDSEATGKAEPKKEAQNSSKKGWFRSVGEWLVGLEEESVGSEDEAEEEQQLASPSPDRSSTPDKPATPIAAPHSK
eukprot:gb/GECG01013676.1/.p1 GENE.gb/GECG01013676.1/~~gb/GECG01013676.1/.p1  ORF type:complete len:500 (+),score=90.12 gb/GECG01013676.1/:1-1500(+)